MKHAPRHPSLATTSRDRSSFAGDARAVIARKVGSVIAAIGRSSFAVVALTAFAANAAPRVPYANDFSTRTSGATPSDRWMESPYIPGALVRPVSSAGDAYNSETAYQDGWTMKANFARTTVPFTVADDGGNQAVLVNPTTSGYVTGSTVAMTPLYNEFTNGVLKVSVDIRTPAASAFNATATAYAGIVPIYKTALDITGTALLTPVRLGMGNLQNSSEFNLRAHALGANASRNGAQTYGYNDASAAIASGRWYRYEATIDIAAESFTASFADLGTEHPTPDREPTSSTFLRRWDSEAKAYTNMIYLYTTPSDATGGTGLAHLKNPPPSPSPLNVCAEAGRAVGLSRRLGGRFCGRFGGRLEGG